MKIRKRDIYIAISMANIIWFTIAVLIISHDGQTVPDALIQWWFIAWMVEFLSIAGVTVCKQVKDKANEITGKDDEQ